MPVRERLDHVVIVNCHVTHVKRLTMLQAPRACLDAALFEQISEHSTAG